MNDDQQKPKEEKPSAFLDKHIKEHNDREAAKPNPLLEPAKIDARQ